MMTLWFGYFSKIRRVSGWGLSEKAGCDGVACEA